MTQATWEITIERRDGSRLFRREFRGREPSPHEEVETRDDAGGVVRATIGVITKHPPKLAGLGIFQISAREIESLQPSDSD